MVFGIIGAIALLGLIWCAIAFLAIAAYFGFAMLVGFAWAALFIGAILLLIVIIIGLIATQKIQQAKRKAMMNGLASSAVIKVATTLLTARPLMTLGVGGALAAAFFANRSKPRR